MTALIMDDEVQIRRLLRLALDSRGYPIREAENGMFGLEVPVLILTVRDQEAMKLAAFDSGADDCITKPFSTAELLAQLVRHDGKLIMLKLLLRAVWGPHAEQQSHYLQVYTNHLRNKLSGSRLETISAPGIGCRFVEN